MTGRGTHEVREGQLLVRDTGFRAREGPKEKGGDKGAAAQHRSHILGALARGVKSSWRRALLQFDH